MGINIFLILTLKKEFDFLQQISVVKGISWLKKTDDHHSYHIWKWYCALLALIQYANSKEFS